MGLDMYFEAHKQTYSIFSKWEEQEGKVDLTNYPEDLKAIGEYIAADNFKSHSVDESFQIGYFRKFNALHKYIVNNYANGVDDCQPIRLTRDQIKEMHEICTKILEDHSKAAELLPTGDGFFFGSTDYDDFYFRAVQKAEDLFTRIERDVPDTYTIIYQASW